MRMHFASQARLKNHGLRSIPNGCSFDDVEFRSLVVMGNCHEDHLYVTEYDNKDVDSLVKQVYNSISRSELPDPFFAPKAIRNGGKADLNELFNGVDIIEGVLGPHFLPVALYTL